MLFNEILILLSEGFLVAEEKLCYYHVDKQPKAV